MRVRARMPSRGCGRDEPSSFPRDRRLQVFSGGPVLLSWNTMQGGATGLVLVAGPQALGALASATMPPQVEWAMTDSEGRLVAGRALPARGATSRASATTGLPWTLHVFEPIGYTPPAGSSRRRLLIFVIASVATLLAIGWYFIWRGVSREVRLARLQSDFVAAVSHEFRSPLTSLRHIGDLLAENRLPTEEQKQRSYAVLTHETDRPGRLVESLLDFARFESGSAVLRLSPTSIANVVRSVVADFQIRPDAGSRSMLVPHSLPDLMVNIDRDAVARALWNLLDNAVKYSPPDSTIWIGVSAYCRRAFRLRLGAGRRHRDSVARATHGVRSLRARSRGDIPPHPGNRDRACARAGDRRARTTAASPSRANPVRAAPSHSCCRRPMTSNHTRRRATTPGCWRVSPGVGSPCDGAGARGRG